MAAAILSTACRAEVLEKLQSARVGRIENMRKHYTVAEDARISVVDDDESMREAIKTLIGSIGLSVQEFASAEDFLNSGTSEVFDCLILDVRMPGLGGLELQKRLAVEYRRIPIVFITAHYSEEQRMRAIEAGAVDYLSKPFTEQELLNAIGASLSIKKRTAYGKDEVSH